MISSKENCSKKAARHDLSVMVLKYYKTAFIPAITTLIPFPTGITEDFKKARVGPDQVRRFVASLQETSALCEIHNPTEEKKVSLAKIVTH